MRKLITAATVSVLLICHGAAAHSDQRVSAIEARTGIYDPALDARVESLLRQMTLGEKVGQLVQYSAGQPTGPGTGRTEYNDMIPGAVGALFNITTAKESNAFQRIAVEKSRLKIPSSLASTSSTVIARSFRFRWPGSDVGSSAGRKGGARRRARSIGKWNPLDVLPDGRHRSRRALGPHGRRRWGRSLPGAAMAGAFVHGYQGERWTRRTASRRPQTLRRLRRGRGRQRLQLRSRFPSTRCASFTCRRFARRLTPALPPS